MWLIKFTVIVIFALAMVPVEKAIYRHISSRWAAYIATVTAACLLLLAIHAATAALGHPLW